MNDRAVICQTMTACRERNVRGLNATSLQNLRQYELNAQIDVMLKDNYAHRLNAMR
jgi:hypothetical protein